MCDDVMPGNKKTGLEHRIIPAGDNPADRLLSHGAFNLVADKRPCHEDDNIYQDFKNNAERSKIPKRSPGSTGRKEVHDKNKDNPGCDPGNRPVSEDAHIILFSPVKKTKGHTNDEIQQFENHTYYLYG